MDKEKKYNLVATVLSDKIGHYLSKKNYIFNRMEITPSMNKTEYLSVVFCNTKIQYEISFSYWINGFNDDIWESIFVHISDLKMSYIVDRILEYEKINYNEKWSDLSCYNGTFEDQVEQFCDYVIFLFDNYLQDWITGERWEEIPFDWGRYK